MTNAAATLLCQLVRQADANTAARMLNVMTGCIVVTDTDKVNLVFKRQTGTAKLTHLVVKYNAVSDLYDVQAHRLNKRTGACPVVSSVGGVYADDLKRVGEEMTGLYFTF
jgi:hypothetical protein